MKDTALLFGVLIILGGVAWFLFHSTPVVEAPMQASNPSDSVSVGDELPVPGAPTDASDGTINTVDPSQVNSFDDCVAVGNPVMESYPRQCRHGDQHFVEEVPPIHTTESAAAVTCTPEARQAEICTMEYAPVCGLVEVQCVTTPCDPVPETFSNSCVACGQGNVISYTEGACAAN